MGNQSTQKADIGREQNFSRHTAGRARIIKLILALALVAGILFASYKVIKATYLDRQLSRFSPRHWVNLDEQDASSAGAASTDAVQKPALRFAIAPVVSPEKSLEIYQGFVKYLAEKLGKNPIRLQRATYAEINDLVRYRQCDIAFVCTYAFIRGEREFGMQALVVPQVRGVTTYQSFILVPQSSRVTSLLDLRGKRFASGDVISTSGWLFPAIWLMQHGEDPNHFFGEHIISGSHDRSIEAVADRHVDGAAVDSLVYDQMVTDDPSILNKTTILLKSPPYGTPPIVVHPNIDSDLKTKALSVLLNMYKEDQGKKILDTLRIERFVAPEKRLHDSVRQAVGVMEGWR